MKLHRIKSSFKENELGELYYNSMALEGGEMAQSSVSVCKDLSLCPGDSSRKAECSDTHL